jgi:hypothetical protein
MIHPQKQIIAALLIASCITATQGQSNKYDFSDVDSLAINAPETFVDIESLTQYLVKDVETDLQKTRAIYTWIMHHISYSDKLDKKDSRNSWQISGEYAFYNNEAVCSGFTDLFEKMCSFAGIYSYTVDGYTNRESNEYRIDDFFLSPDHVWNTVCIEGIWYHIDVTWDRFRLLDKSDSIEFLISTKDLLKTRIPMSPIFQFSSHPLSLNECLNDSIVNAHGNYNPDYALLDSLKNYSNISTAEEDLFLARTAYAFNPLFPESIGYALEGMADSIYYEDADGQQYYQNIETARMLYYESLKYLHRNKMLYYPDDEVYSAESIVTKKEVKAIQKMIRYIERKHL